jgi:hypothetical protein
MPRDPFFNPSLSSLKEIEELIAAQGYGRIRFGHRCYDARLLSALDELCVRYGPNLTLSFYAHDYDGGLDGRIFKDLPNLRSLNLSVSVITGIENLRKLSLTGLSLENFELTDPGLLSKLDLSGLEELGLGNTRMSNLDLTPLAKARELRWLTLSSHTRGFDVITGLPKLEDLCLRKIGKSQSLRLIPSLPSLKTLEIGMGSRDDIREVSSATLEQLSIGGVLGLCELHDLSRFPCLAGLEVDSQPRLAAIAFETASRRLRRVSIYGCGLLSSVSGIGQLPELEDLGIHLTSVDLEEVLEKHLSPSLRSVRLYSGKRKLDQPLREKLDRLGYAEFPPVIPSLPPRGVRGRID